MAKEGPFMFRPMLMTFGSNHILIRPCFDFLLAPSYRRMRACASTLFLLGIYIYSAS